MRPVALTTNLAAFCRGLKYDDLPSEVVEKVKVSTLHGIAVGLAAVERPIVRQALSFVKKLYLQRDARTRLLADGTRVSIAGATFGNSVLFHSRLQEDDYHDGLIHLGVIVLPAALASAEQNQKNGKDFITAVAAGYEIGARISRVYARFSISRGFRSTPVYGPIAAAASSARLLGLNEQQTLSAFGWGANSGGGLLECSAVQNISEMPFQAGFACSLGTMSALLAQEEVVAAPSLLEGDHGFLRAFAGTNAETEKVILGLGQHYHMLETFFKPYPVGGLLQAAVAAMLSLVSEHKVQPSRIGGVELRMNPVEALYPGANSMKPGPMSLPYCVAMAACDRRITTGVLDGRVDSCITDLIPKIKIIPDESVTPLHCRLIVNTTNDDVVRKETGIGINNFEEEAKLVKSLFPEMKIPGQKVAKAVKMIENLEICEDITRLIDLLVSK